MFEVMPQGAVDYIVKNWKDVLTVKAIYASSTKAGIGDFVTMNIKNVVGGEDNIIVVTIDSNSLDDSFFSTDIPVAANLRLSVKMNGSESISSDYLPLSPLLSYDQIIEYTTVTGERMDYNNFFGITRNYSFLPLTDSHIGNAWRIIIEGSPVEKNLFGCNFNYRGTFGHHDLKSLSFVTPIELNRLSFVACDGLVKVDLLNVNTENDTNMSQMFGYCHSLSSLDLSSFDTRNVMTMFEMFNGCNSLTSLDLSGFDTMNVTNMRSMFSGCNSLTSLNLSSFDTKNVTDMQSMFRVCNSLTSLDLSGFDTNNVTDMGTMFRGCKSLTSLNLSSFDTKNVTNMGAMFEGCKSLTSLNLSGFDTNNVTDTYNMFSGCSALTSLDLSGFDMRHVSSRGYMFVGCTNLKEIIMRGCDKTTIEMISKVKPEGAVIITD